ncbi:MAG TPA: homocysteine S-methyltransferase family protein [Gemmatimonadales bacterium]|nr:homocysteine S-methyltransferase family protein [Gemmatimonadales bacterium]
MSKYRHALPQLQEELLLTDGGIETTLIFQEGATLPYFASFVLLEDESGTAILRRYFERYAELARAEGLGLVLETPTWRANSDWAAKLGYDAPALAAANRRSVDLLLGIRRSFESGRTKIVISGNLGPRGDGYNPGRRMSAAEAQAYHASQIETFAATDADMIAAFTMNYVEEAVGIVRAARAAAMPVAISFTTETDGRLPSGATLEQAIRATDEASDGYPVYYMINCAHPTHLQPALDQPGEWRDRIRGLRANASRRSHKELDESPDLDAGNPEELGREYRELRSTLRNLSVVGGCCGTDHRHVAAIARALQPAGTLP